MQLLGKSILTYPPFLQFIFQTRKTGLFAFNYIYLYIQMHVPKRW